MTKGFSSHEKKQSREPQVSLARKAAGLVVGGAVGVGGVIATAAIFRSAVDNIEKVTPVDFSYEEGEVSEKADLLSEKRQAYVDVTSADCNDLLSRYDPVDGRSEIFPLDYNTYWVDEGAVCGDPLEARESLDLHIAVQGAAADLERAEEQLNIVMQTETDPSANNTVWAVAATMMGVGGFAVSGAAAYATHRHITSLPLSAVAA